jgi:hypothetical protein
VERLLATDADLAYSPESQTLVYACSGLAAPFEGVERAEGAEAQPRLPADFDAGDAALIAAFAAGGAEDGHNHDHAGGLAALDTAPLDAALGATSAGPDGATVAAAVSAPPGGADPGIESVFKLHSRPGAAKRILLDFNGGFPSFGLIAGLQGERGPAGRPRVHARTAPTCPAEPALLGCSTRNQRSSPACSLARLLPS